MDMKHVRYALTQMLEARLEELRKPVRQPAQKDAGKKSKNSMQRGAAQGNGWTFFLSYKQSESATEALELTVGLGKDACWLDVHQRDVSEKAMENGVRNSQFFVCILSPGYLESKWCMRELELAFKFNKTIIPGGAIAQRTISALSCNNCLTSLHM